MKKLLGIMVLSLLFFSNVNAKDRKSELDKLFSQLKNSKNLSSAQIVEKKIWEIWLIHPSDDRRGFRLTELLTQGYRLMNMGELSKAYELFTKIILACYKMDKEAKKNESFLKSILNQSDSFRIDVRSSAFVNYLKKLKL